MIDFLLYFLFFLVQLCIAAAFLWAVVTFAFWADDTVAAIMAKLKKSLTKKRLGKY